jgi:TRAP-type C4-dicarboxylate transport system permease small subunit
MAPPVRRFNRWHARINRGFAFASGIAIILMMLAGGADVVLTNLDKLGLESRPLPGMTEFVATMMVVAVFLAVPLAQQRRGHIQVDLVTQLMRPGAKRVAAAVQHVLSGVMFGAIAWYGWKTTAHAWSVSEFAAGSLNMPLWPARFALALGATVMTVQCLFDLAADINPALRDEAPPTVPPPLH